MLASNAKFLTSSFMRLDVGFCLLSKILMDFVGDWPITLSGRSIESDDSFSFRVIY